MNKKKLNPLYKSLIDKKVSTFINVNNIYGGQTEETLEKIQKQHEVYDKNFCNMNIVKIFCSSTENQVNQINLAETYLINLLHNKFGNKC